jgi:hypothetical protein
MIPAPRRAGRPKVAHAAAAAADESMRTSRASMTAHISGRSLVALAAVALGLAVAGVLA